MREEDRLIDAELWSAFRSGDKKSFKELYLKYYTMLYNYGIKLSGDSDLAEDCLQELFLKLWKNKTGVGKVSSVKSYLFTSYSRTVFDNLKKISRNINSTDMLTDSAECSIEETMIADQSSDERIQHLKEALSLLSKRQKEVIYLFYVKQHSYREIEAIMSVKYQTIRNCMHEAVKVLRKHLVIKINMHLLLLCSGSVLLSDITF